MTDTSSISFQFKLTNLTGQSKSFHTKQNVKKRVANIVYISSPLKDTVKLEYVGSTEAVPSNSLTIGDRSDEVFANSRNNTVQEIIGDRIIGGIPVANKNFLVTKEFAEGSAVPIPLFFKAYLSSSVLPESIRIFNKDGEEVATYQYKIVRKVTYNEDTGVQTGYDGYYIFNSLENIYNHLTGDYEVYYLQYTYTSGGIQTTTTTILDNELAYPEATYQDYWSAVPGELKPWSYVFAYISNNEESYRIVLPSNGEPQYAIRYIEKDRISIQKPIDYSDSGPWFPRVANAGFLLANNVSVSKYDIPEFNNQAFNPIVPYKFAARAKGIKVTDHLFKLPNEDIISETPEFGTHPINIIIEEDSIIKYGITNDSTLIGSPIVNHVGQYTRDSNGDLVTWASTYLIGQDSLSGLVYLSLDIKDTYTLYADYTYKEKYYTLSSLLMNPIFDSTLTKEIRVVYIVPRNLYNNNQATQEASIKWLGVTTSGVINSCSQDGRDGNTNISYNVKLTDSNGYSISGVIGLYYSLYKSTYTNGTATLAADNTLTVTSTSGFPPTGWLRAIDSSGNLRYFEYDSKTSTAFTLTDNVPSGSPTLVSGVLVELVNFVDEFTLQTRRSFSNELTNFHTDTQPGMLAQYFVIAELSINPPHGINKLARVDIREDGGGIIEDKYEEAKLKSPEVQWFNDFNNYDGQPYPGKAVSVVKLPISLKETYTLEQIKAKVEANIPMGVYPLIRFYGHEPTIISMVPSSGAITVNWQKEGPEFIYSIWYAKKPNTDSEPIEYILANTSPIFDGTGSYNTYTISGLDSETAYIVKVIMEDRYYMWWYSYTDYDSIGGGLGLNGNAPDPPFGNVTNFQFSIA